MQIHYEHTKKKKKKKRKRWKYMVLSIINYNGLEADVWLQNIKEKITASIFHKLFWKLGVYSIEAEHFIC